MYCTMDYSNKFMFKIHYGCAYNLYTVAELEALSRLLRSEVRVKSALVNTKNVPMLGSG
jgi:hypothetical protein